MEERSFTSHIGIVMYIILSSIDKFVWKIPNHIYIPLAIIGIIIIIIGFVVDKKRNKQ